MGNRINNYCPEVVYSKAGSESVVPYVVVCGVIILLWALLAPILLLVRCVRCQGRAKDCCYCCRLFQQLILKFLSRFDLDLVLPTALVLSSRKSGRAVDVAQADDPIPVDRGSVERASIQWGSESISQQSAVQLDIRSRVAAIGGYVTILLSLASLLLIILIFFTYYVPVATQHRIIPIPVIPLEDESRARSTLGFEFTIFSPPADAPCSTWSVYSSVDDSFEHACLMSDDGKSMFVRGRRLRFNPFNHTIMPVVLHSTSGASVIAEQSKIDVRVFSIERDTTFKLTDKKIPYTKMPYVFTDSCRREADHKYGNMFMEFYDLKEDCRELFGSVIECGERLLGLHELIIDPHDSPDGLTVTLSFTQNKIEVVPVRRKPTVLFCLVVVAVLAVFVLQPVVKRFLASYVVSFFRRSQIGFGLPRSEVYHLVCRGILWVVVVTVLLAFLLTEIILDYTNMTSRWIFSRDTFGGIGLLGDDFYAVLVVVLLGILVGVAFALFTILYLRCPRPKKEDLDTMRPVLGESVDQDEGPIVHVVDD